MNKRFRVKDKQAIQIGLKLNSTKRYRLSEKQLELLSISNPYKNGNPDNLLVIGDLHAPFDLDGYLQFCRKQQELFNCGTVLFIGDVIDLHYSSYHNSDPDGYGAGEELDRAVDRLEAYHNMFPNSDVIIGNHDRLAYRKAFSSGLSKRWIRDYKDVLNTPTWNFVERVNWFGIDINHGEGGSAKGRMKKELCSQVQGHLHSELYVEFLQGNGLQIFGVQVGCGVDTTKYAFEYGKNYKKSAIGCAVILNKGTLPIAIPMKL